MSTATKTVQIKPAGKSSAEIAGMLRFIGDPTRVGVLRLLAAQERSVGELCAALGVQQASMSHHLSLLRAGRIVESRRQGKQNIYALTPLGSILEDVIQAIAED